MTGFIDLGRRFHHLTDKELEAAGSLAVWYDREFSAGIGWPELLEYSRVILLGEAGSGKTVEMRAQAKRLVREDRFAFFVELESLDREPMEDLFLVDEKRRFEAWKADREAPAWFFLDAVDELKLTGGKLDRALRRLSKALNGHLDLARIIISCRPSDWRSSTDLTTVQDRLPVSGRGGSAAFQSADDVFTEALRHEPGRAGPAPRKQGDLPGQEAVKTVVMLPMSHAQIRVFTEQSGGSDPAAFLTEVEQQDAWIFAGRPLDLADLMEVWTSSGRLRTRAQQHEANVRAKWKDQPDRPDNDVLADARAQAGAERLALAIALTRTRTIRSPEQALDVHRADGVLEPAGVLPDWTEAERMALLRCALFDPATCGRVRFHHRSVQEYLAARHLRELRERGMSTKALFRLLFAERYGVEVVFPSMRAVAAWLALWNDAVRKELIKREPDALLLLGDPGTLDIAARRELVRAFVATYDKGDLRGPDIPMAEVRRLAHPGLARVIRECWGDGSTNDDVSTLLIGMIWQGPVKECADLALDVAFDTARSWDHRVLAIRALLACGRKERVRELADRMLAQPASWPDEVVPGVAEDLFPEIITVDELTTLMGRTPEPKRIASGFRWVAQQIVETIDPRSEVAVALRDGMADLVWRGREDTQEFPDIRSRFDHLAPALAMLCHRQLSEQTSTGPHAGLIRACVIASRCRGNRRDGREPVDRLRAHFDENAALRSSAFWAELAVMDEITPTDDNWNRYFHVTADGLIGYPTEADQPWLLTALKDQGRQERRAVALHALSDVWRRRGRVASELGAIRAALKDDAELVRMLEECTAPPKRDEAIERWEHEHREWERNQDVREAQGMERWKEWREALLADPDAAFSGERREETLSNLYSWLRECKEDSKRFNVWDRKALTQAFGPEIAARAEEAFRALWRTMRPVLWSALPAEERNQVPCKWIHGFLGVSAEASAQGWAASLSPDEAGTAAAYATMELGGFAPFIADLAISHPAAVEGVIGGEVSAELDIGDDHDHLPALQDLTCAGSELKQLLIPRLPGALKSWPDTFTEETGPRRAQHLGQVLRVLGEANSDADREVIARECAARYGADPAGAAALAWLKGLFRFDAVRGTHALVRGLGDSNDPGIRERAIETFAALFGDHNPVVFEVAEPAQHACLLGQLVRCAHTFIRREDDQVHEGVYSPDTRDDAQRVRGSLLSRLLDTPGPEAYRVILELADEDDFAHIRDWLRLRARQRAAADAEFPPFTPQAVAGLETCREAPPNDSDGLFAVMMDRLDDLAHDLAHSDFTDRRTVRSITEESEMQRTLAWRLSKSANGAYTVAREEEVADRRRTDIRLSTVDGGHKVVVEVKIADKGWSLNDLERTLRHQLAGQYLRHSDCRAGCLLLTYHGRKPYWVHPDTHEHLEFPEVVAFLKDRAQALEKEKSYGVRIGVFGLDLTDPPLAPAHRGN